MTLSARVLVSEEEFMSLPETTQPMELLDGEVIRSPSPTIWHQSIQLRLARALSLWADSAPEPTTVLMAPLDVRFGRNRILQPDVMVFLAEMPLDTPMPVARIPEICVEIVSQNRTYDRVTKHFVYAEAGVKELWLVDSAGWIERRRDDGLKGVDEIDGTLTSPLLPGFELDVKALLR